MRRHLAVLVAVAMLVAAVGPALAVADPATQATDDTVLAQQTTTTDTAENETAENETTPGAMLSGTVGVQKAEMRGEIERRSFGFQVAQAASNDSKAQVLQRTQEHLHDRVGDLEQQRDRLHEARENGTISEAQYRARVTVLAAESAQVQTMTNASTQTARGLPVDVLEANGVNVTAIEQLHERARTMAGPEVAAIARQVAGPNVGTPMGPPDDMPGGPQGGPMAGQTDRPGDGGDTNGPRMTTTAENETTTTSDEQATTMSGGQSTDTQTTDGA